jgi:hypothetical protein
LNIARPPNGFIISVTAGAQATLDSVSDAVPRIGEIWAALCERLKFTAHREGQPLPNGGLVIQFPGDPAFGVPVIAVCFSVLGDTVTVTRVLVRV